MGGYQVLVLPVACVPEELPECQGDPPLVLTEQKNLPEIGKMK